MNTSGPSTARRRPVAVLVVVVTALALLIGSLGLAASSEARPARTGSSGKTRVSVKVPTTATAGQPVLVTGKIRPRSRNRDVQVQILQGTVWRLLDRTRTAKSSRFAVAVTLPAGQQFVRVVSRAKRAKLGSSKRRTVTVAPAPPSPDRGSALTTGAVLSAGQYLRSPSGRYRLVVQPDGYVVLSDLTAGTTLWTAGRPGSGNRLQMQADGDLVILGDSGLVWQAGTSGFEGSSLLLQDDGNLVTYSQNVATWSYGTGYVGDTMLSGTNLQANGVRRSPNRRYALYMQSDGNFGVYDGTTPIYSVGTQGNNFAAMQADGNLVIYPVGGGAALFSTDTSGFPGAQAEMQDDGNLVIYQGGAARWSSKTGKL